MTNDHGAIHYPAECGVPGCYEDLDPETGACQTCETERRQSMEALVARRGTPGALKRALLDDMTGRV